MSIQFYNEDVNLPDVNFDLLKRILKGEVRSLKFKLGLINYIFCSDLYLLDMNVKFLKHDFYTDVITFDYSEEEVVAGDIYISTDRVLNNSVIFGQIYADELVRVLAHGLLHLLKFNDKESEEIVLMRRREDYVVNKYNSFPRLTIV